MGLSLFLKAAASVHVFAANRMPKRLAGGIATYTGEIIRAREYSTLQEVIRRKWIARCTYKAAVAS